MHTGELKIPTDGKPIEAFFMCKEEKPDRAFLILPGKGYTINHFVLDFLWRMAAECGFYSLKAEYRGFTYRHLGEPYDHHYAAADAGYVLDYLNELGYPPEKITVCGKSLGTIAVGNLVADRGAIFERAILLTPVLYMKKEKGVFPQWAEFNKKISKPYLIFGGSDPFCDRETARQVFPEGLIECYPGADHGLSIDDDYLRTLEIQREIIANVKQFISELL